METWRKGFSGSFWTDMSSNKVLDKVLRSPSAITSAKESGFPKSGSTIFFSCSQFGKELTGLVSIFSWTSDELPSSDTGGSARFHSSAHTNLVINSQWKFLTTTSISSSRLINYLIHTPLQFWPVDPLTQVSKFPLLPLPVLLPFESVLYPIFKSTKILVK